MALLKKHKHMLLVILALSGMVVTAVMVYAHNKELALASFLSCGVTCSVHTVTPKLFGIMTAKLSWILFSVLGLLSVILHENPKFGGKQVKEELLSKTLLGVAGVTVVITGYALYQMFVLEVFSVLTYVAAALAISIFLIGKQS